MNDWWDLRCTLPPRGYKPGPCNALLMRVSSTGGLELKCHNCREVTVVHRSEIEQYQVDLVLTT